MRQTFSYIYLVQHKITYSQLNKTEFQSVESFVDTIIFAMSLIFFKQASKLGKLGEYYLRKVTFHLEHNND